MPTLELLTRYKTKKICITIDAKNTWMARYPMASEGSMVYKSFKWIEDVSE